MNPPRGVRRALLALPAIGYAIFILILSSRPGADLPSVGVGLGDRALHLLEYFVFGVLLLLPVRGLGWRGRLPVLAVGIAYAAFDESFQTLIPGRIGDATDFLMDAVGLLAAVALDLAVHPARAAAKGS